MLKFITKGHVKSGCVFCINSKTDRTFFNKCNGSGVHIKYKKLYVFLDIYRFDRMR